MYCTTLDHSNTSGLPSFDLSVPPTKVKYHHNDKDRYKETNHGDNNDSDSDNDSAYRSHPARPGPSGPAPPP